MSAQAQPVRFVQFAATATIGTAKRSVTIHISCALDDTRINSLAIAMDVPDAEALGKVFDVDGFEGPSGSGAKSRVAVTTGATTVQVDFAATGSFGNDGAAATSFTLDYAFSPGPGPKDRASLAQIQGVAAVLSAGPSQFSWRIDNAARGGPPLVASATLAQADSDRARNALSGCRRR